MDWASVAGVLLALAGIVVGQSLEGGKLGSLLQPAAFAIVVIGTFGAVMLQTRFKTFLRGVRMLRLVFAPPADTRAVLARDINAWNLAARRDGLLSLERYMLSSKDQFNTKGLRLIVDGINPDKLRQILDTEITAYETEERQAVRIWESAAGYSPTIGILGAVLGLIHVMENLTDPSKLGSGIAVAFVSTIYGVGLANLFFYPIANKLKAIVTQAVHQQEIAAAVFYDIATGDHTRVIDERIATLMREH
ncbi:flagellar motor protein [Duganella sp. BJB488]|uniref:Flagellar motor protein n=1 Tax=Duganella vulcania TaxID=2692166 RepID=A0A845G8I6_9BURK|nr:MULTISPECIES: flagellar motor protein [Duganella]MYM89782.1 flagellar motor protein [Duganella vulcania]NVD73857.1 flagellar motor protein [Duganella sp. BJB1802]RFP25905.1 flagellar motor protein [Duganella sp. BJB489]RFP28354.1 flagellar motor protein [Duganella sp. BJB488]RFP36835.1 flagellar motor protein [Duganella sp. BJB480]